MSKFKVVILLIFLIGNFTYATHLWFSASGFYIMLATLTLLSLIIFADKRKTVLADKLNYYSTLVTTFIFLVVVSFSLEVVDINANLSKAMWINRFLLLASIGVSFLYLIRSTSSKIVSFLLAKKYFLLLLFSLVIQLTLLRVVKAPPIDIYNKLLEGPLELARGNNPYTHTDRLIDVTGIKVFTYGPASIYLFLPVDILFGDPRYLLIMANFIVAFVLYKMAKGSNHSQWEAELLSLIYLFNPRYLYFLKFSYVDVMIVGLLALAIFMFSKKKYLLTGITLALVIGIKIFYIIPVLFFLKNKYFRNIKLILAAGVTSIILWLPFLIADWKPFVFSMFSYHLSQKYTLYIQEATLTFATFVKRQWGFFSPSYIFVAINVILFLALWLAIKKMDDLPKTLLTVSWLFLSFIFFSFQALPGYYLTPLSLMLLSLATIENKS